MTDVFASPQWFGAWLEAFADKKESISLSVAGTTVPFLVGHASKLGMPLRFLRAPVNAHTPYFSLPFGDGVGEQSRLVELLAQSRCQWAWDWLQLELVPWSSVTHRVFMALNQSGWPVLIEEHPCTAVVDIGEDWDTYVVERLSKKMRTNTNRAENGLKRKGELVFGEHGNSLGWMDSLKAVFSLEARSWKGLKGSAIDCKPSEQKFYKDVLKCAQERGALRIYTLHLDESLIAANIVIIEKGKAYGWKTAYCPDLAKFSPGNVLQRHVLRDLYRQDGIQCLDMLDPVTDWKRRWATRIEPRAFIRVFSPTVKGRLLYHVARRRVVPRQDGVITEKV